MGKYSGAAGRWLAQPARRKASISAPVGEAEGPRLRVEDLAMEIRAIPEDSGPMASIPQKTPAHPSKPRAAERRRAVGAGLQGRDGVPCMRRLGGGFSTCTLLAARFCSLPTPVPQPGPGSRLRPWGGAPAPGGEEEDGRVEDEEGGWGEALALAMGLSHQGWDTSKVTNS